MIEEVLKFLGLGDKDREVYVALMRQPSIKPSDLALQLDYPRTTVQNVLLRLERRGLAMELREGKVLRYAAAHPENISSLLEMKRNKALVEHEAAKGNYQKLLPQMLGMMHSSKSLPQVRFFKGKEGARQVLFDTLSSKTELKDFANIDAMFEVFKDVNDEYLAAREKSKVTKRSLLLDTTFARSVYQSGKYSPISHKGYKWIPADLYPFSIEMNIYSGKISYLTYVQNELIGVIIENEYIYETHNSLWNLIWNLLPDPTPKRERKK